MKAKDIPVPENWPPLIRQAMLHAISLAHFGIIVTRSQSVNSPIERVRLKIENNRLKEKLAASDNQLRILKSRFSRIPSQNCPHYSRFERMDILSHKAACGWNLKQTAQAFMVEASTISSWMRRIDDDSLISIPVPWNKYPDFLRYAAQQLKTLVPAFGKKKIAEYVVRAGLYLSATSVARYLQASPKPEPDNDSELKLKDDKGRIVRSHHPNHTWMIDLTTVPTTGGFWASWFPNSLPQCWPFCYWIGVIIDHFSRKIIGFAVFKKPPASKEITQILNKAVKRSKHKPKYIITDKGSQFTANHYKTWCEKKKIKPRYGAVGKYGSIAIIERFIKSLKNECTRKISAPFNLNEMQHEISLYVEWYNQYRPHAYLKTRTPQEVYRDSPPLRMINFENASQIPKMVLKVSYLEGRKHLPVVEIRKVA